MRYVTLGADWPPGEAIGVIDPIACLGRLADLVEDLSRRGG
ncbi:hypothetical protein AB0N62_06345 [Streptomyces sp. NPDC093982]